MAKNFTLATFLVVFFTMSFARDYKADAIDYLKKHPVAFKLTNQDILDLKLVSHYTDDIGITHVWLQQSAYGINLYNGFIGIHFDKNNKVIYASGDVTTDLKSKINTKNSTINEKKSIDIQKKF